MIILHKPLLTYKRCTPCHSNALAAFDTVHSTYNSGLSHGCNAARSTASRPLGSRQHSRKGSLQWLAAAAAGEVDTHQPRQQEQEPSQQQQQQQQQQHSQQVQQLTCRRCFQRFSSGDNHSQACSFHPAMYTGGEVAKAIGFVRESSAPEHQLGAVVGRTGLMRFWDCCGAADEAAPGCVQGYHMSFDDETNATYGWKE